MINRISVLWAVSLFLGCAPIVGFCQAQPELGTSGTSSSRAGSPRSVLAVYLPSKTGKFKELENIFRRERFLEGLADELSKGFVLPKPMALAMGECGRANAFYYPSRRMVIVCSELLDLIHRRVERDYPLRGNPHQQALVVRERAQIFTGAFAFILFHEIGHALIHILQLPITGREEDVADQIATFFFLNMSGSIQDIALAGRAWFFASSRKIFYGSKSYADEHSLDPQRMFNIACWAYGKSQTRHLQLARDIRLPTERARRCPSEYTRMEQAIRVLLKGHVRF